MKTTSFFGELVGDRAYIAEPDDLTLVMWGQDNSTDEGRCVTVTRVEPTLEQRVAECTEAE